MPTMKAQTSLEVCRDSEIEVGILNIFKEFTSIQMLIISYSAKWLHQINVGRSSIAMLFPVSDIQTRHLRNLTKAWSLSKIWLKLHITQCLINPVAYRHLIQQLSEVLNEVNIPSGSHTY